MSTTDASLPPLPPPGKVLSEPPSFYKDDWKHHKYYTAEQLRDYARAALAQQAPANEWKQAIDDELVTIESAADSYESPRAAVRALIDWHCSVQIDPAVSSAAAELMERGRREALAAQQAPAAEPTGSLEELRDMLQAAVDRLIAAKTAAPAAEPVASLSDAFEDECARTDSLLTILGLDPWRCRTEGGSLMPRKVLEQMAEKRAAVADDHLRAALQWIAGATTQTPGLTDAQLGKLLSGIKACAEQALAAAPQPPQAQPLTLWVHELHEAANAIHAAIDAQTYDERRAADWGLPDDHEFTVSITAAQARELSRTVANFETVHGIKGAA